MSSEVITGQDGKRRCAWAGADDTAFRRYHHDIWVPVPTTSPRSSRHSPWACSRSG